MLSDNCAQIADTADQDGDKSRTYDYARVEYAALDLIVYLGSVDLTHRLAS